MKRTTLKQNRQPLLQNQKTSMQKKNPTSINYEKPTVIHRINASWRAKWYQKKSYPGEEIVCRRKRTLELRRTFYAQIKDFLTLRKEGSEGYLGLLGVEWL